MYIYAVFDLSRPLSHIFLPVSKVIADCDDSDGKQKIHIAASSAVINFVDSHLDATSYPITRS